MELGKVIDALYDSEINCSVSTFWDGGFTVKLGDEMNGFLAERDCKTSHGAAEYLDQAAREHHPESSYALGKDEWERLNDVRNARNKGFSFDSLQEFPDLGFDLRASFVVSGRRVE